MSKTTPGETAYTAYWAALASVLPPVAWSALSPVVQRAWEAAAAAAAPPPTVLDLYEAMGEIDLPEEETREPRGG